MIVLFLQRSESRKNLCLFVWQQESLSWGKLDLIFVLFGDFPFVLQGNSRFILQKNLLFARNSLIDWREKQLLIV